MELQLYAVAFYRLCSSEDECHQLTPETGLRIQNTDSFTNEIVLLYATGGFRGRVLLGLAGREASGFRRPVI